MKSVVTVLAFLGALNIVWAAAGGPTTFVCYFSSWAVYRPGAGRFDVDDIDPHLCTHLVFGFAALDNYTMDRIIAYDPWNELCPNEPGGGKCAYQRFTNLKKQNPKLKTILAIGGWNEGSEKYSKLAASPTKRANFVQSVIDFLAKYGFDGLDFDWEYPGTRGGDPAVDKANFITILQELKNAFAPRGYMLTSAVSPGQTTIDIAYDLAALSNVLDQIHLMTYDYHGAWEPFTGLNSPLYGNNKYDVGNESTLNVEWTVDYYISKGVNPSKIILGMALYGRGFTLDDPSKTGFKAPASKPIEGGPYTRENGSWSYLEICTKLKTESGWTVVRDPCYQSPYAYKGNQWIGYDDLQSLELKAQFVASRNLGGAFVWTLDYDDAKGYCTGQPFALVNKVKSVMYAGASVVPPKCGEPLDSTPVVMPTTAASPSPSSSPVSTARTSARPSETTTGTQCALQYSTTAGPPPTTPGSTAVPSPFCPTEGLNAYPGNCTLFLQCVSNGAGGWIVYTMRCADGTVFSPEFKVCVIPRSGFVCPPAY